jgi:DNA-binding PadR family transcriptional regulator
MPRRSAPTRRDPAVIALETLALGLLMPGPQHGYTLYQDYVAAFAPIWKVGRSQFYAALNTLHAAGELDAHTEWQDEHPPRKVYALTARGRGRILAWVY